MEKTKFSAPGKLILFGEYAVLYGFPCIGVAVDKRIFCEVQKVKEKKIFLSAPEVSVKNVSFDIEDIDKMKEKKIKFLLKALSLFFQEYKIQSGLKIKTKSQFSFKYGLGSSAATVVSLLSCLFNLFQRRASKKEIFDLALRSVFNVQKIASGADVAFSTFGGIVYFITPGKIIKRLKVKNLPLIVGYTGKKVDTSKVVKKVDVDVKKNPRYYYKLFSQISFLVEEAKKAMEYEDWERLGALMQKNQEVLERFKVPSLRYGVSSKVIDKMIKAVLKAGAFGAKLSGAGLGDCIVAFGKDKEKIERAIKEAGGVPLNLSVDLEGVKKEI